MPGIVTLNTRKIVILGSRSVGKSSLVKQFIDGNFSESYYPTIETTATKTIMYNGIEYPCEIIDTAGQDEFSQLKSQHAIGIHGYVLVYSINSRASFNMIQVIYDKILNYSGLSELLQLSRQVDSRDGQELALRNKTAWIEASALRNENVARAFELWERAPAPAPRKGACLVM
ncbi:small GTPase superfamily [Mycena haematopus]|nr:small GTPase superfamily [Mycena haematopus]